MREPRGKARTDRNGDRKDGEEERDDTLGAADLVGERRRGGGAGRFTEAAEIEPGSAIGLRTGYRSTEFLALHSLLATKWQKKMRPVGEGPRLKRNSRAPRGTVSGVSQRVTVSAMETGLHPLLAKPLPHCEAGRWPPPQAAGRPARGSPAEARRP